MNSSTLMPMPADCCASSRREIALEAGQIWSAQLPQGARVNCARGVVWLTQSDDATDYVLSAGQSFVASQEGSHVVVQAINAADAMVTIEGNKNAQ